MLLAHRLLLLGLCLMATCAWSASLDEAAQRIDEVLVRMIEAPRPYQKEQPALVLPPLCDDATFVRRAFIDIAGRLPDADEVSSFLASSDKDKRSALIDDLARSESAADWRFQRIADALRVVDRVADHSIEPFGSWLRAQCMENTPWDELVHRMLLATGDIHDDPATGLLLRDAGDRLTTATSLVEALLGANMQCAQCHDHPFDNWTQMQAYRLAACLPPVRTHLSKDDKQRVAKTQKTLLPGARRVGNPPTAPVIPPPNDDKKGSWLGILESAHDALPGMRLQNDYKYRDGKPGEVVTARFITFNRRQFDPARITSRITRETVAVWFTRTQRDRLSEMMAVRMWQWMFGTPGRPAEQREGDFDRNPLYQRGGGSCRPGFSTTYRISAQLETPLAKELGLELRRCDFGLREFQRILGRTLAYQRVAIAESDLERGQTMAQPAPIVRRLPPEVLWDALQRWLPRDGTPSVRLPQVLEITHPIRLFGRGSREWTDESEPLISHGLARFLCNSDLTQRSAGGLGDHLDIKSIFLNVLGRPPTADETTMLALSEASPTDVAWALINATEFLFNH